MKRQKNGCLWKFSSAGRASALQAEGHRFDPYNFHQKKNSADGVCGNSSVVERYLAKVNVAGSSLVSRSTSVGSEPETDFDRCAFGSFFDRDRSAKKKRRRARMIRHRLFPLMRKRNARATPRKKISPDRRI